MTTMMGTGQRLLRFRIGYLEHRHLETHLIQGEVLRMASWDYGRSNTCFVEDILDRQSIPCCL